MKRAYVALACVLLAAQPVLGASLNFNWTQRPTTALEIGHDPATANKTVYDFFATTSGDILSVNGVTIRIDGTTDGSLLYQNANGGDAEFPFFNPFYDISLRFPSITADSWITTPGFTTIAGGGFSTPNSAWFDADSIGAVTNFSFARLTAPTGAPFRFSGTVSIVGDGGQSVEDFPFVFETPEPASGCLASLAVSVLLSRRRRKPA
jgi:hypothetical protein